MTEVAIFNFEGAEVRTEVIEGKILFNANDICEVLGYINPRQTIEDHCKKDGVTQREVQDSIGRVQMTNFINESNIYRLIFRSKMPNAEKFTDWVVEVVLPSIRKTGMFKLEKEIEQLKYFVDLGFLRSEIARFLVPVVARIQKSGVRDELKIFAKKLFAEVTVESFREDEVTYLLETYGVSEKDIFVLPDIMAEAGFYLSGCLYHKGTKSLEYREERNNTFKAHLIGLSKTQQRRMIINESPVWFNKSAAYREFRLD